MATKTLKGKFLPQYRTAAQWSAADSVLLRGEIGVESDTRKFKFGDGVTPWNSLGYAESGTTGGSGGDDIIVIPEGTPVNDMDYYPIPRDQGTIIPIVIKAGAESAPPGGYEYVGTVQYIYGGNNPEMMINVCAAESDMIARNEWYQAHIDTEGISDWVKMGGSSGCSLPFDGPIPGYELVYSYTGAVLQLASGTEVTINFDKAIPAAQMFTSKARFMIEADIVSVSGNTLSNVARVPIAIFKPTAAGQPVFEYMIQSIATGTNIGRVRLIITSWIRESGSTGDITGCNLMAQVNNLNPSLNYALTFPGMYVKSSGGGTVADDEPAVPDERMVIIDVHACGVEAGEGIELTFELISTCSGWYTVGDDLKVRVSFAQVSSELGEELANYVGERFYIEASNNGECWFGPVPASGNIEAELV